MWTSRTGWLDELAVWADTEQGRAACARKVRVAMLLRVAEALAAHADHGTGRHCAVTNAVVARIAGCSERTVRNVRGVLSEAGLGVEIQRGTGRAGAPSSACRPSVWHLISRREAVDKPAVCRLPPSRRDRRVTHVGKNSPSTRKRAPETKSSSKQPPQRGRRYAPRPLHIQRLAAGIVASSLGLDHVHTGHICDALTRSGLDLDAWTARGITGALNADMQAHGWSWPNHIERPGAFLATRLQRLPARPGRPHRGGVTAAGRDHGEAANMVISDALSPPQDTIPAPISTPASASHRAAMLAEIRAAIAHPKVHR